MKELVILCKPPTGTNQPGRLIIKYDCSLSGGSGNINLNDQDLIILPVFGDAEAIHEALAKDARVKLEVAEEEETRVTIIGGVVTQIVLPDN